jgi:hypothetical protein
MSALSILLNIIISFCHPHLYCPNAIPQSRHDGSWRLFENGLRPKAPSASSEAQETLIQDFCHVYRIVRGRTYGYLICNVIFYCLCHAAKSAAAYTTELPDLNMVDIVLEASWNKVL